MTELDRERFEGIKRYVGLDQEAVETLRALYPIAMPHCAAIIEDFYQAIEAHPDARQVITGGQTQIERLKCTLRDWLRSVLLGPYDLAYLETHSRIGHVHVRIGLPQRFMFAAMNRIRRQLLEIVHDTYAQDPAKSLTAARAVNQILDLELAIMLDAYREHYVEKVRSTERLATIGQLAASIGHELRNPLGVAESSLFLISERLKAIGVDDENVSKHQERILGQLKSCGKTISNLLDLARDRPPDRARVGLRSLIEHALERSGVETPVVLDVDDALHIEVDPDDFVHVIVNLLVNASDAQNGTGSVRINARDSNGGVELVITDEGPGIPAEIGGRVFDALFTTKPRGTGLGLALCRRILQAHGGEIRLEPSERGARFRLWVPNREHWVETERS